jgi:hypothetical protein
MVAWKSASPIRYNLYLHNMGRLLGHYHGSTMSLHRGRMLSCLILLNLPGTVNWRHANNHTGMEIGNWKYWRGWRNDSGRRFILSQVPAI